MHKQSRRQEHYLADGFIVIIYRKTGGYIILIGRIWNPYRADMESLSGGYGIRPYFFIGVAVGAVRTA